MEELIFVIGELLVTETNLIESVVYPREKEYPNNLLAISKDGKNTRLRFAHWIDLRFFSFLIDLKKSGRKRFSFATAQNADDL